MSKYETTKSGLVKDTETGATGVFRTVGGRRIFIKEGQDLATAMKESGKFSKKEDKENKENNKEKKVKILYHQTKAESLEDFDESKRQSGLSDTSTPKGIFLKETDEDIGLPGKNQLKMEVTMEKPLNVKNREELKEIVSKNNERYKNIIKNEGKNDEYYGKLNDALEDKIDNAYAKYYYEKDEKIKAKYQAEMDSLRLQQDDLFDQWENEGKNVGRIAQEEMTRTLKGLGYDSVILEEDEGSFGRKVKSYIVFDLKQLKQIKK